MSDITVTTTEGGVTVVTDTLGAASAAAAAASSASNAATSASAASTSATTASTQAGNASTSASAASTSATTASTQAGNASTSASAASTSASTATTQAATATTQAGVATTKAAEAAASAAAALVSEGAAAGSALAASSAVASGVAGGTLPASFTSLKASLDVVLTGTKKLYLDGVGGTGGDTYLLESSANVLDLYAGGVNSLRLTTGGAGVAGALSVSGVATLGTAAALRSGFTTILGSSSTYNQLVVADSNAYNASPTAQISLSGKYTSGGTYVDWAYIRGTKVNATDGDQLGQLSFGLNTGAGAVNAATLTASLFNIINGVVVSVSDTTDATSTTAASLKTAGGLGVAKKAYIAGPVVVGGAAAGLATLIEAVKSNVGGTVDVGIYNSDSTNAASSANLRIFTNGASAGDPTINLEVNGVTRWAMGIDNSDGDKFKISYQTYTVGTNDVLTLDSTGATVTGTLSSTSNAAIGVSGGPGKCLLIESNNSTTGGFLYADQTQVVLSNVTAGTLSLRTSNTDRVTVGSTGNVTVASGNLIMGTSGKGIDFSATSNGSGTTTSEVLSDYEEGTWTPAIQGLSNSPIYDNRTGQYTKFGRMVHLRLLLQINGGGTCTYTSDAAYFKIGGLPFTAAATGYVNAIGVVGAQNFGYQGAFNDYVVSGTVNCSIDVSNYITLTVTPDNNTRATVKNSGAKGSFILELSIVFHV